MENPPVEEWPFGTKVEIGGRTMLRPGLSLVGLTGMIYLTAPNAPAGCQTVIVDWAKEGYTPENGFPEGSLPMIVNVPRKHLTLAEEAPVPAPASVEEKKPFRPRLRGVDDVGDVPAPVLQSGEDTALPTPLSPLESEVESRELPENPRPKLRLV